MLALSKKVEYGLIALVHMSALKGRDVAPAKNIAESCSIPPDLLGKVLQGLTRGGLVESTAGAKGGYRLRRPLEQLTLGSVIEALEGPVRLSKCQKGPEQCRRYDVCTIRDPVARLRAQLLQFVNGVSLTVLKQPTGQAAPTTTSAPSLQDTTP